MNNTLIILAHPSIEKSVGNKTISEVLATENNVEIRHLDQLYPNFKIDVAAEQTALLNANTIVFQFPLFWYNMPAILKHWIDNVLLYGFAFGKDAKLKDKKILVSFTIGSPVKDYTNDVIQKITFPFQGLASYCNMKYVGELFCNDINDYSEEAKNNAIKNANTHARKLIKLINEF